MYENIVKLLVNYCYNRDEIIVDVQKFNNSNCYTAFTYSRDCMCMYRWYFSDNLTLITKQMLSGITVLPLRKMVYNKHLNAIIPTNEVLSNE